MSLLNSFLKCPPFRGVVNAQYVWVRGKKQNEI